MSAGVEAGVEPDTNTRAFALVQGFIGVFLAVAYTVRVGPTLVDVWTEDSADIAFGQLFFTTTALVAVVVVALSLFAAWELWRSAEDDRFRPTAHVLLIMQAVSWGAVAFVVAVNLFGSFEARPGALMLSVTITLFSIGGAAWLAVRDHP